MIPSLLKIKIEKKGRRKMNLWIPLFLLWPFIILFALVVFTVCVLVQIVKNSLGRESRAAYIVPRFWDLLCALRGFHVDVSGKEKVLISVI